MVSVNDSKIIEEFEEEVAKYAGAKYGVAVSSQTNAIFLCLELLKMKGKLYNGDVILIPKQTYMSVPMSIINAGMKVKFVDIKWSGCYPLECTRTIEGIVWDSAVRFTKDMYVKDSLYCISFQYRKALPIGRGGMILTDNREWYTLLKKLRFNGRSEGLSIKDDKNIIKGWNMYMTPEQAARGLTLMVNLSEHNKDISCWSDYPDISDKEIFN